MCDFDVQLLPGAGLVETDSDVWRTYQYDAFNGDFKGRVVAYLGDTNPTWHYYELEPECDDRAQVFYGLLSTNTDDPDKEKLKYELAVAAEKCHDWVAEQESNNWKRLAYPIRKGEAMGKAASDAE